MTTQHDSTHYDACRAAVTSGTLNVTVAETLSSIEVTPRVVGVLYDTTQQFTATALDQFGHEMTTPPTFTWALAGYDQVGEIDSSGLYTAPDEDPDYYNDEHSFQVTASAGGLEGSADVGYYSPGVFTHAIPLYADGSTMYVDLTDDFGIDDHIVGFSVSSGYMPWYDDISFTSPTGTPTIDFEDLDDLTEVNDQYEDDGVLFAGTGFVTDLDPPDGNHVYFPGYWCEEITATFPEMVSDVSFTILGIVAQYGVQFATLWVNEPPCRGLTR